MKLESSKITALLEILDLMSTSQLDIRVRIKNQLMTTRDVVNFEDYMKDLIKRFINVVEE